MVNDSRYFVDMAPCVEDNIKTGKKGAKLEIKGKGTAVFNWNDFTLELSNVYYVPSLTINLLMLVRSTNLDVV